MRRYRKTLITAGGLVATTIAIASMGVGTANADVPRCGGGAVAATTATFTAWEPAGQDGQWLNTWQHDFTITLANDGSFVGTGVQNGQTPGWNDGWGNVSDNVPVSITGQLGENGRISYTETRDNPSRTWILTDAQTVKGLSDPSQTDLSTLSTGGDKQIEWKISAPLLKTVNEGYKNHGQFVSAQGGGSEAAQACAGMPLTSKKGQRG